MSSLVHACTQHALCNLLLTGNWIYQPNQPMPRGRRGNEPTASRRSWSAACYPSRAARTCAPAERGRGARNTACKNEARPNHGTTTTPPLPTAHPPTAPPEQLPGPSQGRASSPLPAAYPAARGIASGSPTASSSRLEGTIRRPSRLGPRDAAVVERGARV